MTDYNNILRTIPTLESVGLLGVNAGFVKKKKKRTSDFINVAGTNIIGSQLIKTEAQFLNGF